MQDFRSTWTGISQEVLSKIIEEEKIPAEWRKSTLLPIFKNEGDIMCCGNYRGIKFMCHSMTLYERIMENRLRNVVNICEHQFGFIKGKSRTDNLCPQTATGEI